jgi:DNA-binding transcriptional LysR family regulator
MYEGPEFRHLRYFIAVAEECNFIRAARRLHVSQPAISKQINQLEDGLNAKLFLRGSAGASLKPAGHAFLLYAKQMLSLRDRAVQNTSLIYSGVQVPLRFGYSPFINHELVREALQGYRELVPEGRIEPSSECSGTLTAMVSDGHFDAALVSMPIAEQDLFTQLVCTEELLVCLRADDPLAQEKSISRTAVQNRLKVFFARMHHPLLYDELMRKFAKAGITLQLSHFVSAPAEMEFLVKEEAGFALMRDKVPLDAELTRRRIEGISIRIKTAFVCHPAQKRSVLPLLAFRLARVCGPREEGASQKRPSGRVAEAASGQLPMFGSALSSHWRARSLGLHGRSSSTPTKSIAGLTPDTSSS